MSIHEVAKTGILPERCLRKMAKEGRLPAIKTGNKTLINFDRLVQMLNSLGGETA
jgi:excisionase family DNA binding protein